MHTTTVRERSSNPLERVARVVTAPDFWSTWGVPLAVVLLMVYFSFASDVFLEQRNLLNILRQASVTAIAAVGATLVLISGGIDISQGAVMAVTGLVAVRGVQEYGLGDGVAIVTALAIAALLGAVNGLLAEKARIPAFIATLGTALIFRGMAFVNTEGRDVGLAQDEAGFLRWLGQGYVGPVPVPVVLMLALYAVFGLAMRKTVWGMHTYAVGSSERAARIAGVPVAKHRISVYMVAGVMSGLDGMGDRSV